MRLRMGFSMKPLIHCTLVLHFACEQKHNNVFPFLDAMVRRSNIRFLTSVYQQLTFMSLYKWRQSFCSKQLRINLIKTLVHWALVIFLEKWIRFWNWIHWKCSVCEVSPFEQCRAQDYRERQSPFIFTYHSLMRGVLDLLKFQLVKKLLFFYQ